MLNGTCVSSCPANYDIVGQGSFGLRCVARIIDYTTVGVCNGKALLSDSTSPCTCSPLSDCHQCNLYNYSNALVPSTCRVCKNGKYLFDGNCISLCPNGTFATGLGTFDLRCVNGPVPIQNASQYNNTCDSRVDSYNRSCSCQPFNSCHSCIGNGTADTTFTAARCIMCSGSKYLSDGVCVDVCPVGSSVIGLGTFGLQCDVLTTPTPAFNISTTVLPPFSCTGRNRSDTGQACACDPAFPNCQDCVFADLGTGSWVPQSCSVCKNSKVLLNGQCVDACPTGMIVMGKGTFGLYCIVSYIQGYVNTACCEFLFVLYCYVLTDSVETFGESF